MNFELLKKAACKPELYEKGNSVMWTDPYISKNLLELHINPNIDVASRSYDKIKHIIEWILGKTGKTNMKILDLGCGPGLYSELFAEKGHSVTGVDFSDCSIQYAIKHAKEKNLKIEYIKYNYLDLDFDCLYDLVILIYLDFCALIPSESDILLKKIYKFLKKDGMFIFDVVNGKNIDKKILKQSWEIHESGFWKNSPYITLNTGYHYPNYMTLANQHIIIDENDNINTYIFWLNYFEKNDLLPILKEKGFAQIQNYQNILPPCDFWNGENITFYTAIK